MGQAVQDSRDLLAMAWRLRRIAQEHRDDRAYRRLFAAAAEIEERAASLGAGQEPPPDEKQKNASHAPINLLI